MEIDCFLANIIGAKDSLLVQINQKLGLGLPIEEAKISNLNPKLKAINKGFLLTELNTLCSQTDSWLWLLNELRNHSLHRAMINKRASVQVHENINSNTFRETYFADSLVKIGVLTKKNLKFALDDVVA